MAKKTFGAIGSTGSTGGGGGGVKGSTKAGARQPSYKSIGSSDAPF